jgi:redox-sensitive bicupin YhaK (pirin superfamily)
VSGQPARNEEKIVDLVIAPRQHDLGGGFAVRRVLPAVERRMVGPFVFFDHFGPTVLRAGTGLDVRPHPHIGLATVTYLFAGEILHRDSLGTAQTIHPGAVNWMTAGRGIVHSERTPARLRSRDNPIFGIQSWIGLPRDREETDPAFAHYPAEALPAVEGEGKKLRLVAGSLFGKTSPVATLSPTLYADVTMTVGASLEIPAGYAERAAYPVEGAVDAGGSTYEAGQLMVFHPKAKIVLAAKAPIRLLLLGGEPLDGPRHVWWNLVSSSRERIETAKRDWQEGRFPKVPGDETEFIPLPA